MSLAFIVLGCLLLTKGVFAAQEALIAPILTVGQPVGVTIANFIGNGSPINFFKLSVSGPAGFGDTESECFPRGEAFPAENNYTVVLTFATTTWTSYTTPATGIFQFYVSQYSDSSCTTLWTPVYQLENPDGGTDFELQVNPGGDNNLFPLLTLSTSTAATGITSPETLCAGFYTTSSGLLDNIGAMTGRALCIAGSYLFVPSQNAVNSVLGLRQSLYTKIPFGWLYQVSSTVTAIENPSATTTPISITIPNQEEMGVPTTTIDLFNPSTIDSRLDSIFEIIRGFDIAILSGLFCYWVFNKARHFTP